MESTGNSITPQEKPKSSPAKRLALISVIGAGLVALAYFLPDYFIENENPSPKMKVGGTSVVAFMMDEWGQVYHKEKGLRVEYESTGSTEGLAQMIDKKFTIGFTHAPMSEEQKKKAKEKGGDVVHIPVVLCGVVPVYNLKDLSGKDKAGKDRPPLNFTGELLGKIFCGEIDTWDHEELKKLNKGVELPKTKITVVHRKDSSGTTLIFTEYLLGASKAWKEKIGKAGSTIDWPVGEAAARNNGIAYRVPQIEGAIGYVDLLFAKANLISYGAVQNKDGTAFIHAEPENLTASTKALVAKIPEDLTFKLIDQPGQDAYPISGAVWAVCYQNQSASDQKNIVEFLQWVIQEGQKLAKNRTYAPLPQELIDRASQQLKTIKAQ